MTMQPRVLVVDDVEANIIAMEALLDDVDCEVVRATSGNEALRELLRHDFAVVLLDVQMPGMDGFEVARLARSGPRSREVPIIFVTAMLETSESVFEGYESGAVDVLFKPITPHILLSKVKVFLDLYRSKRRLAEEVEAHRMTLAELEAFNYSVSHDLRAPLRSIDAYPRILLEDYGAVLDDEGKRMIGRISKAAIRMDGLITDLLRLSQVSRTKPTMKPIDLSPLADQIVAETRLANQERAVSVVVQSPMPAVGDDGLMRIALENMIRNAWKFTSKVAHPTIEVGVITAREGRTFFVKDNGAGFDEAHANKLFAPFQRLHSSGEFEGTGIGLAIVQRIIQHHRGKVWAEAAREKGATFFFTLPQ